MLTLLFMVAPPTSRCDLICVQEYAPLWREWVGGGFQSRGVREGMGG